MLLVFLGVSLLLKTLKCHDFGNSFEINGAEISPFYETIIMKDVADTLNEFDNKGFDPLLVQNESESEEDVEDLLSEYQHYLNRAHKQIKTYMEKTKPKNKIPLLRREKFTKPRLNLNDHQDIFFPIASRLDDVQALPIPTKSIQEILNLPKFVFDEIRPMNIPSVVEEGPRLICPCKSSEECVIRCSKMLSLEKPDTSIFRQDEILDAKQDIGYGNNMNIRVNVDIEMPKQFLDMFNKMAKHLNQEQSSENFATKPSSILNLSSPFLNFPIPMRFFGNKRQKSNLHEFMPLRKITIHKKKKSKASNGKKHHKKVITIHKLEPQRSIQNFIVHNLNLSEGETTDNKSEYVESKITNTSEVKNSSVVNNITANTKTISSTKPETQTIKSIYLMVNISNSLDDNLNLTNSVETDSTLNNTNKLGEKILTLIRKKRQVLNDTPVLIDNKNVSLKNIADRLEATVTKNNTIDKLETKTMTPTASKKNVTLSDTKNTTALKKNATLQKELSYWPPSNNVTVLELERNVNKSVLNISKEITHDNHTESLEPTSKEVDWNDVEKVATWFLTSMGTYMSGILTFCSDQLCHSMKCGEKSCIHRLCTPDQRYNKLGHCVDHTSTDSKMSMEAMSDLPPKTAFEIVDSLETKMLGRLYGKATFCIGSECDTIIAFNKKIFKSRCSKKEMTAVGDCM